MRRWTRVLIALLAAAPISPLRAQPANDAAAHLGTTARVLLIGTRPEDEDNALIAWLSLGRHVETAYLSLTRGESGINTIGSEREAPLAVLRTAELLAERQRDGAHQYFTRAYDFGSTPFDSVVDGAWPYDSLLVDVVSVVRAFRPQVIIALTRRDDRDATRRVTARLAAAAFSLAADSTRLPSLATSRLPAWSATRLFALQDSASSAPPLVGVDVGEFQRDLGRSFAEVGTETRQLQRSQHAVRAPSLGRVERYLRLDSTRVAADTTVFGMTDTTLSRFHVVPAEALAQLDTLRSAVRELASLSPNVSPDSVAAALARIAKRTGDVRLALPCGDEDGVPACPGDAGDLSVALNTIRERATRAMLALASIVIDGAVAHELVAAGDSVRAFVTVYNGGHSSIAIRRLAASSGTASSVFFRDSSVVVAPNGAMQWSRILLVLSPSYHWWQVGGLVPGTFIHNFRTSRSHSVVGQLIEGEDRIPTSRVEATLSLGGVDVPVIVGPLAYRELGALRGDIRRPVAGVPPTSLLFERPVEYERAALPIDHLFRVFLWSARSTPDTVAVSLQLPPTLHADSVTRTVALAPFGSRNVFFRLRGKLAPGLLEITATAYSVASAQAVRRQGMPRLAPLSVFNLGIVTHEYPHVPTLQFVRFAKDRITAVDVRAPRGLNVAYVKGRDDVQTPLGQLQLSLHAFEPSLLSVVDLSAFSTVLIGTGALENDALAAETPALLNFAQRGGTIVILPGNAEVSGSGLLPYPIAFDSVPSAVRDPGAIVHLTDAKNRLFTWPNVITTADFDGWIGERARNVPATFDPRYQTLLSTGDAGRPATAATLLAARVGKGMIIYMSLTIDEQLAAANPGAARLMINLLAAGLPRGNEGRPQKR